MGVVGIVGGMVRGLRGRMRFRWGRGESGQGRIVIVIVTAIGRDIVSVVGTGTGMTGETTDGMTGTLTDGVMIVETGDGRCPGLARHGTNVILVTVATGGNDRPRANERGVGTTVISDGG